MHPPTNSYIIFIISRCISLYSHHRGGYGYKFKILFGPLNLQLHTCICKASLLACRFQANLHISWFICVAAHVISFYLHTYVKGNTTNTTPTKRENNKNSRVLLASLPGTRTTWRHFVSHFVCVDWFLSFERLLLCDACALHTLWMAQTRKPTIFWFYCLRLLA